ncbi:tyrosine-protein phosphatase [Levilactobacillus wangkuiensis]|uniref:tyrosine-protein phosphatase n=1 Tax=Levilactobacillus wangkuiensis TaxID=2799566 RepID=UPI0019417A66|nr:tyrosine-protein phosphatase [Levilactobacillus wangkuiensis]
MTNNRKLNVTGGWNFRELGGYTTVDGHSVKWHKLLRTDGLARLTPDDQQLLTDYGVVADVDFRSNDEKKQAPDKVPAGVTYHFLPVFPAGDETDASATQEELEARFNGDDQAGYRHMLDVYQKMVTMPTAQEAYHNFFGTLLSNEKADQSVLFHCTAGKDRTGMGAFLALSALNVDPQTIHQDYLLTNPNVMPLVDRQSDKAREEGHSEAFVTNIRALSTVNPDYLAAATKVINTQYGGTQDYLHDVLGLSHSELTTLKRLYLD